MLRPAFISKSSSLPGIHKYKIQSGRVTSAATASSLPYILAFITDVLPPLWQPTYDCCSGGIYALLLMLSLIKAALPHPPDESHIKNTTSINMLLFADNVINNKERRDLIKIYLRISKIN